MSWPASRARAAASYRRSCRRTGGRSDRRSRGPRSGSRPLVEACSVAGEEGPGRPAPGADRCAPGRVAGIAHCGRGPGCLHLAAVGCRRAGPALRPDVDAAAHRFRPVGTAEYGHRQTGRHVRDTQPRRLPPAPPSNLTHNRSDLGARGASTPLGTRPQRGRRHCRSPASGRVWMSPPAFRWCCLPGCARASAGGRRPGRRSCASARPTGPPPWRSVAAGGLTGRAPVRRRSRTA